MQQLPFPIIDPHIHQWDPYNTPTCGSASGKAVRQSSQITRQNGSTVETQRRH